MQCPNCEELIPDDVTVCPSCGAELPVKEDRPEAVGTEVAAAAEAVEAEESAVAKLAEDAVVVEPEDSVVDDETEEAVEAGETAEVESAEEDVTLEIEADEDEDDKSQEAVGPEADEVEAVEEVTAESEETEAAEMDEAEESEAGEPDGAENPEASEAVETESTKTDDADEPETNEPEADEPEAAKVEEPAEETAEQAETIAAEEPIAQPKDTYKWVFVGISAVLMLLLAFAPWIGLPGSLVSSLESDEIASMVLGFVGVDLHAVAYTLVSGGLAINNNLVPMLHSASELGANFGLDLSTFDAYAGRLQMAGTLLIVLWAVNIAALAYALYCDAAGRKPFRWAYPLLVVTCALVLVVLFVGIQRLTQGSLGETFENMGSVMDFLQPGYWLTLVAAIAATVARFVLGRREG